MRRAATILAILFAAATLSAQSAANARGRADHGADEAAVSKIFSTLGDALNGGNFKTAAALWDDDGVYYSVEGQKVTGPAQIEAALSEALGGAKLTLSNSSVHWASSDVAVTQGTWQASDPGGGGHSGLYMAVVRKAGPAWKFVEMRPWVPGQ